MFGLRHPGRRRKNGRLAQQNESLATGAVDSHVLPMIDDLYSRDILRLTTQVLHIGHLANPQATADRVAKLCGSTIHIELNLEGDEVAAFAQQVQACALGQAAAAIVSQNILGATVTEVFAARDALRGLLKGEGVEFPSKFSDLKILQTVKDYPARHASTLLALEAVTEAISSLKQV